MPLNIEIIDGPMDTTWLKAIADTYGSVIPRFRDTDFIRKFFNENPFGKSYNAFIKDGDRPVGHLGIIPMNIWDGGKLVRSGNHEALFVDEAYRKTLIDGVPAAMALLSAINAYAFTKGIIMLHNSASYEVGALYMWDKFERIIFQRDLYRHYLSYNKNASTKLKQLEFSVVWLLQSAYRTIIKFVPVLLGQSKSFSSSADDSAVESAIKSYMGGIPPNKWAVALDRDSFNWRNSIGLLKVFSLKNDSRSSILVTTGAVWEIIGWHVSESRLIDKITMLSMILNEAQNSGARELIVNKRLVQNNPTIRSAMRMVGFISRSMRSKLFVRSDNSVHKSADNIEFNNLLHFT